jgi:hypothetical protein
MERDGAKLKAVYAAPTVICAEMQMLKQMQNPVGAGLPAIAEYQTTIVLNVKTPSRASPLPQ